MPRLCEEMAARFTDPDERTAPPKPPHSRLLYDDLAPFLSSPHNALTYGTDERQTVRSTYSDAVTPGDCTGTFARADPEKAGQFRGGAHGVCIFAGLVDPKR